MLRPEPLPLETPRLLLRAFTFEDAPAMYAGWAADPEVTRFLTWLPHESVQVSHDTIGYWLMTNDPTWCVVEKASMRPVGSLSVVSYDLKAETAEAGYCYSRAVWGRGYGAEALRALIDALFTRFGAKRVTAKHDLENPNSGRVMQKAGMTLDRIEPKYAKNNFGMRDMAIYQILRGE